MQSTSVHYILNTSLVLSLLQKDYTHQLLHDKLAVWEPFNEILFICVNNTENSFLRSLESFRRAVSLNCLEIETPILTYFHLEILVSTVREIHLYHFSTNILFYFLEILYLKLNATAAYFILIDPEIPGIQI